MATEKKAFFSDTVDEVEQYAKDELLPYGSGWNEDWEVKVLKRRDGKGIIIADTNYEGMDEYGFYLDAVPVRVEMQMDTMDPGGSFTLTVDPEEAWDRDKLEETYSDGFNDIEDMESVFAEQIAEYMRCGYGRQDVHAEKAEKLAAFAKKLGFATPVYDQEQTERQAYTETQQALLAHSRTGNTIQDAFAKAYAQGFKDAAKDNAHPYATPLVRAVATMLREKKYTSKEIETVALRLAPEAAYSNHCDYHSLHTGFIITKAKNIMGLCAGQQR